MSYTFYITYNANGGSGAPSRYSVTVASAGTSKSITLSSTKPTKSSENSGEQYTATFDANGGSVSTTSASCYETVTKYTFKNWNTKSDGSGTTYTPGQSITRSSSLTLYAQYTATTSSGKITTPSATRSSSSSTVTITYNANGGSCDESSASGTKYIYYSNSGWYTEASGGTKRASNGGSYTPTVSETLYAHWTSSISNPSVTLPTPTKNNTITTRTVTIDTNQEGSSPTHSTSNATISYECSGWYTSASGGSKVGNCGASYSLSSSSTYVYAHYTETVGEYSAITLPTESTCTRTGYQLLGFSTNSNATTADYNPGASFVPSANNQTLYAVWKANGCIKINEKSYLPRVYHNGKWTLMIPRRYKDGEWKIEI